MIHASVLYHICEMTQIQVSRLTKLRVNKAKYSEILIAIFMPKSFNFSFLLCLIKFFILFYSYILYNFIQIKIVIKILFSSIIDFAIQAY